MSTPRARFAPGLRRELANCLHPCLGQRVQSSTGSPLSCRNFWVLSATLQQPHILESVQRTVERPVCGEQPFLPVFRQLLCELVAMEFIHAPSAQLCGGDAN
jgi:hypothetical protein